MIAGVVVPFADEDDVVILQRISAWSALTGSPRPHPCASAETT
jgi:hypothetical protein